MERLGGGLGVMQTRRNRRLSVGLKRPTGKHLDLILATNRDLLTPAIDRGAMDAKRPCQRGLSAKVADSVCLSHDAIGLTCLTGVVKHSQPQPAYARGMEAETISERIAHRLEELKMTQAELARRCGIDRSAVNQLVSGLVKNIRPEHLVMAADALGLEIRWLITGRGPRLARNAPTIDYDNGDLAILSAPPEIKQIFKQIIETTQNKAD